MAKISLTTRKNIKEAEVKLQANIKKLQDAIGVQFELDVDFPTLVPAIEERGYPDQAGSVIYDWYLTPLVDNIIAFCKDPVQKESFMETFASAHKIKFEVVPKIEDKWDAHAGLYSWSKNDNGALTIVIPKDRFVSNVDQAGKDLSKSCSAGGSLSVATRKNIQDSDPKRAKYVKAINDAAGVEFTVDIDWNTWAPICKERGFEDRVGDVFEWYLKGLAYYVAALCKDDMSKEAFVDANSKKTIHFIHVAESELDGVYSKCTFDNGVLTVRLTKSKFPSNTDDCGKNLESQL